MQKLIEMLGIEVPILLAPMIGPGTVELTAAVSNAGGLGAYPCAPLSPDQLGEHVARIRALTNRSLNLNFFCHKPKPATVEQLKAWRDTLQPYYDELGVTDGAPATPRKPFDAAMCDALIAASPKVASFHFGLPEPTLLQRIKSAGIIVLCSATTVTEARHATNDGADAIIAQGLEAGGHRGNFINDDIATQPGTFSLLPQIADAVNVPVIAAGGIADARGVAAAFALGADAVQVGTAYMLTTEAKLTDAHRAALKSGIDDGTALTNLFTGRPARGYVNRLMRDLGPINPVAPPFPEAAGALQPLRAEAEKRGSGDFTPLWSGQSAALAREMGAGDLTRSLAREGFARLEALATATKALRNT
jgi:nitronate monooxygenase